MIKYQIEVFLPSREDWLSFDKPLDNENEAIQRMNRAQKLDEEGGDDRFKYRIVTTEI